MRKDWEGPLERWTAAGLIDNPTALRIRTFENAGMPGQGLRWPVLVALSFGTVLLGTGVLLFVSAHWDELSPAERMIIVVATIGGFHAAGAMLRRFEGLPIALHTLGTISLGGGIALAGQIYHLSEHWPSAILLWAVGSALAWVLLRQWPQGTLTAILAPVWAASEWWMDGFHSPRRAAVAVGICGMAFTYFTAREGRNDSPERQSLVWVGGIALIPTATWVVIDHWANDWNWSAGWLPMTIAVAVPLGLAFALRRQRAIWNVGASTWLVVLVSMAIGQLDLAIYFWCFLGSLGLAAWGMHEQRSERVNLAFLGFGITVLVFYFSNVMAKLDRALSLLILGALFLGGGWLLERTRRRIISTMGTEPE